jgi:hypothetical protein
LFEIVVGAAALKDKQRADSPLEGWSQTGVDNQPVAFQYFTRKMQANANKVKFYGPL